MRRDAKLRWTSRQDGETGAVAFGRKVTALTAAAAWGDPNADDGEVSSIDTDRHIPQFWIWTRFYMPALVNPDNAAQPAFLTACVLKEANRGFQTDRLKPSLSEAWPPLLGHGNGAPHCPSGSGHKAPRRRLPPSLEQATKL